MKKLIYAKDAREAQYWLYHHELNPREYQFIRDIEDMRGRPPGTVVIKLSGAFLHPNADDIEAIIKQRQFRVMEMLW